MNTSARFPSGRTVGRCRQDAKTLARAEGIPLHHALDRIAAHNGLAMPWPLAMNQLNSSSTPPAAAGLVPMTLADIQRVLDREPHLSRYGIGLAWFGKKTMDERWAEFNKWRAEMLTDDTLAECNRVHRYLAHVNAIKSFGAGGSSYGLKHAVERYTRALSNSGDKYVSNGAFICAALHNDFKMRLRGTSPNPVFNMSARSPAFLWERLASRGRIAPKEFEQLQQIEAQLGIAPERRRRHL
jgi:hypothetical protein